MATQIVVPTLGEAITEVTLVNWLINEGDPVRRGDEIASLETDKTNLPLECPTNGVLLSILVHAGENVSPGQVLALVGQPGDEVVVAAEPALEQLVEAQRVSVLDETPESGAPAEERGERVSPAARRMARQLGIELSKVPPSAPGARITTEDVERYAHANGSRAAEPPGLPYRRIEQSRIQKAVAERMVVSAQQIPQFSISIDVDVSRLLEVKQELALQGLQASITTLLVQLTARVLDLHPLLNARFDGDAVLAYETVNMAVAAATPAGLVAPVIHSAEKLSLVEIARRLEMLTSAARENRLSLGQVSEATFTLSNLGMHGVKQFVPLVNPPQSAILGVGAARNVALPTPGWGIRSAWLMTLTVSADHRVLDGEAAALFMASLKEKIEKADFVL